MNNWYEEMERAEQEYDAKLQDEARAYQDGYQQGRADAIDEIHNMLHDRLCELSNQEFSQMSKNEYQRYASVLSELNKWMDALEQLKEQN